MVMDHFVSLLSIENFWDYIKENYYPNKAFASIDLLEENLCTVLSKIHYDVEQLISITAFPWIINMNLNAT